MSFLEKLEKIERTRKVQIPLGAESRKTPPEEMDGGLKDKMGVSTFLSKFKKGKKEEVPVSGSADTGKGLGAVSLAVLPFEVDMYKTPVELVIFANVPGVEKADLDIQLEKEGDIVTIRGKKKRPEKFVGDIVVEGGEEEKLYILKECHWGSFFRQITLPEEVDIFDINAKLYKGVLILRLPLKRVDSKKRVQKRVEIEEVEDDE